MSLPWVRLETNLAHNPKVLDLVANRQYQAVALYVFALGYSGAQGLDGYVPAAALPVIHGTRKVADQLVAVGLWRAAGDAGWDINGWADYQYTSEENQQRTNRAKSAAQARWDRARKTRIKAVD